MPSSGIFVLDLGHLSNEDGADAMIETLKSQERFIWTFVKKNNIKELYMTMENQLAQARFSLLA